MFRLPGKLWECHVKACARPGKALICNEGSAQSRERDTRQVPLLCESFRSFVLQQRYAWTSQWPLLTAMTPSAVRVSRSMREIESHRAKPALSLSWTTGLLSGCAPHQPFFQMWKGMWCNAGNSLGVWSLAVLAYRDASAVHEADCPSVLLYWLYYLAGQTTTVQYKYYCTVYSTRSKSAIPSWRECPEPSR